MFSIQRVAALYNAFQPDIPEFAPKDSSITSILRRSYATKPVSRPKAHTGRTTTAAKKAPTTSKTKAAKKPAVKKTSPKAKPTAKSKAKPRIKPKPKAGKKPKPKPKPKKVLTEAQKKAATIKELKVTALTTPHSRPFTAWTVLAAESQGASTTGSLTSKMKEASAKFKNLSPEQLEVGSISIDLIHNSHSRSLALQPHCESKQGSKNQSVSRVGRVSYAARHLRSQPRPIESEEARRDRLPSNRGPQTGQGSSTTICPFQQRAPCKR